jgi:hypothetical protein
VGKHSVAKKPLPAPRALLNGATAVRTVGLVGAGAVGLPLALVPTVSEASVSSAVPQETGSGANARAAQAAAPDRPFVPANAGFAAPTDDELTKLRFCEASGRYATNTGNGFYGAYQFDAQTWRGLGLGGLPHQAPPDLQDAAASALEQTRGWQPWPSCSRQLGLVPRRNHGDLSPRQVIAGYAPAVTRPTPSTVRTVAPSAATAVAPAFGGHVLSTSDARTYRSDVRLWQERMAQRGWPISVDGYFGQQSADMAHRFATEKDVREGFPGEVGKKLWKAAWTLPVG